MKKRILLSLLAVLLCLSGFLWFSSSQTVLLDNDVPFGFFPAGSTSATADPEIEIDDFDVPLTEIPPTDALDSAGEKTDLWGQFSQTEIDTMNEILQLVNEARTEAGLLTLELEPALCGAAHVRAQECVTNFGHTRPDGTKYKTAIAEAGITSSYTGENAATGHSSAKQVVEAWLRSEGHRANILNEKFTKLGVGFEKNTGNKYKGYAWVQLFTN